MARLVLVCLVLIQIPRLDAAPPPNESLIEGRIIAEKECGEESHQVWVSQGKMLIYQSRVPGGGSFRFHLVPGSYEVRATTERGCFAESEIKTTTLQAASVTLRLTKKTRSPAQLSQLGGAGCACVRAPCHCASVGFPVPNYIQPSWYPW